MTPLSNPNFTLPTTPNSKLIQYKNFYFNRIKLAIIYDTEFNLYTISIFDTLTDTPREFSPYGIFMTLESVTTKFNSIQL